MKIYGYMDGDQLVATYLEDYTERVTDADGNVSSRTVTAAEQAARLSEKWKPVEPIDTGRLDPDTDDEVIIPVPYDAGDRITYRYDRIFDRQKVRREIADLKAALAATDYQVIKCYEASLLGTPQPYDIAVLHIARQQQRDRINELETKLSTVQI